MSTRSKNPEWMARKVVKSRCCCAFEPMLVVLVATGSGPDGREDKLPDALSPPVPLNRAFNNLI